MSSLGKILIILNAVLGLFVFGFASALVYKSDNFKQKYLDEQTSRKTDTDQLQGEKGQLDSMLKQAQAHQDSMRRELETAKAEMDSLQKQVGEEKTNNAAMRGSLDKLAQTSDNFRQANQDLQAQLESLRKDADMVREEKTAAQVAQEKAEMERGEAVAKLEAMQGEMDRLRQVASGLTQDLESERSRLEVVKRLTGVDVADIQAQPQIDGKVVDKASDVGLVALNVGKDQGVKVGFSFDIYNEGIYSGKVIVDQVEANYCSARIVYENDQKPIEPGFSATTNL